MHEKMMEFGWGDEDNGQKEGRPDCPALGAGNQEEDFW